MSLTTTTQVVPLENDAKTRSRTRSSTGRNNEQCTTIRQRFASPVIIHAPHTSRHISDVVRRELLLSDTELTVELDAVTDAGVLAVVEALTGSLPTIALERPGGASEIAHLITELKRCADETIAASKGRGSNEGLKR